MKKYLMISGAALAFAATFTSCSKTDLYDPGAVEQQKEATMNDKYAAAFEKAFGKVGSNVDWGFSSQHASTRGLTRTLGDYPSKGNLQPSISFPRDCDAGKFNPDLTNIPSYDERLRSLGTEWWTPTEITVSSEVYIDKVQAIVIKGGEERSKLYIKAGTYDFTNETFDLCKKADLYLLSGATLILNNVAATTAKFDIYIASGATLIANGTGGFVADAGAHVYNHGTITVTSLEVNSSSFLYNVGTLTAGTVSAESNDSRIVNDATINSATVVVNAGAVQNNDIWNVSGTTYVTSNNSGWVNNGHWTTLNYAYTGGSDNVINNCLLTVTNDFDMNLSSGVGAFKIDTGGGVLTRNFYGGRDKSTNATSGPFKIVMGQNAVFKVTETATLESGRGEGFGFFGPSTGGYAVFQAQSIVRNPKHDGTWGAVTYGYHLYVSAGSHFAQGNDGMESHKIIFEHGDFTTGNNIYAPGFKSGKPSINIPATTCSPGFVGGDPLYRVIAEDLSASDAGDFDFNDVVFDVVKYEGGRTTLRLQACGGTLPLKIGSNNGVGGVEVHSLYGDNIPDATTGLYRMWNTSPNLDSHPPVDFTVAGQYTTPEQLLNLRIEVEKDGSWMLLTATKGVAACKILVDDRFPIIPECTSIANAQGNFTTYVQGHWNDNDGFWWIQSKHSINYR